jgi:hypothetical protein
MNWIGKFGFYRVRLSAYTNYEELSEQHIKYEILNYENS